jgi:prevent-host-death family protein
MAEINVRDARRTLKALLDRVAAGEEIVLLRRGKPVARLAPPAADRRRLPALGRFRGTIYVAGRPLSREVAGLRREEERP